MFLFLIKPIFVILPANVIAILAGVVFGPVKGFFLSIIGLFISGTVAFYISRCLGKDFVEGILGKRLLKLDNDLEEKGFKILLLLRLPPILPFDPLSYGCGLSKIKYRDFILASLLGVMPETLCYSIMGKNFHNPFSPAFIIAITVVIVATIFSKKIISAKERCN